MQRCRQPAVRVRCSAAGAALSLLDHHRLGSYGAGTFRLCACAGGAAAHHTAAAQLLSFSTRRLASTRVSQPSSEGQASAARLAPLREQGGEVGEACWILRGLQPLRWHAASIQPPRALLTRSCTR